MKVKDLVSCVVVVAVALVICYWIVPLDSKERRSIESNSRLALSTMGVTPVGKPQSAESTAPSCAGRLLLRTAFPHDLTFTTYRLPSVTTGQADRLERNLRGRGFRIVRSGNQVAGVKGDDLTVVLAEETLTVTAGPCSDDPAFLPAFASD